MITASITIVTIRPHTNGIERGALGDGRRHRNQERDAGGKIGDARWMRATAATSSELLCHLQQRQGWRAVAHQLRIQLYLPHHLERPPHCDNNPALVVAESAPAQARQKNDVGCAALRILRGGP